MADPHHHRFSASHSDILSGLTWATLDLTHLGQNDYLTSFEGLNLTLPDLHNNSVSFPRRRTRRLAKGNPDFPAAIELEIKFMVPLFTVYESDNLQLEMPLTYGMELPQLVQVVEVKEERRVWDDTVGIMLNDLEGLISMLGVDGSGCVRKALCEVAAMPSIAPEGLVGEMVQLFVKHLGQLDEGGDTDDITDEESEIVGEQENGEEQEEQTQEPETEKQGDESGKEKQSGEGEADEQEEKHGKQKESQKRKTGKERSRRRRPRKIDEYVAAGVHGKQQGDCWAAFPECPHSLHTMNLA